MLTTQRDKKISNIYEGVAKGLDIPDTMYEEAEKKYIDVGNWLGSPESELFLYDPKIILQGSLKLGTAIKPISEKDEYDVDLVCRLNISPEEVTKKQLKEMVGQRLYESPIYKNMLEEKKRCWVLNYADETQFHMDILPAIQHYRHPEKSILITDKELNGWLISNPEGYAEWFFERMSMVRVAMMAEFAKAHQVDIEEIPDYTIRTPLQRVIQLLKRQRDTMFQNDPDNKPISIIITTLAAHAYNGEEDLYEALQNILEGMPNFIGRDTYGRTLVANPSHEEENFADKWAEDPTLEAYFYKWLQQAKENFKRPLEEDGILNIANAMKKSLGETPVNFALKKWGSDMQKLSDSGRLRTTVGTTSIGASTSISNKKHTFYGK